MRVPLGERVPGGARAEPHIAEWVVQRLATENQVSEGHAMYHCQGSTQVINLIEEFQMHGQTYIVTKFARGGDLLGYLTSLGVDRLPESTAR